MLASAKVGGDLEKINSKLSELDVLFSAIESAVDASGNSFKKTWLFYRYRQFIDVNAWYWSSIREPLQ